MTLSFGRWETISGLVPKQAIYIEELVVISYYHYRLVIQNVILS